MAFGAERYFAMGIVAETASQLGMPAFYLAEFFDLRGMTGHALLGDIIGKFNNLGGVRIGMAALALFEIEMRLIAVALAALRYIVLDCRTVAGVAILTGHACFMGSTACGNIGRRFCMTFCAIVIGQLGRRICCKSCH